MWFMYNCITYVINNAILTLFTGEIIQCMCAFAFISGRFPGLVEECQDSLWDVDWSQVRGQGKGPD